MRNVWKLGFLVLCATSVACGSSGEKDDGSGEQPGPDPIPTPEPDPNAMPCGDIGSGFEGDEVCILPPPEGQGVQLHVGPTDYGDPAQIEKFTLGPGEESTECYYFTAPNEKSINFFEQIYRMRPGSHHLIIYNNLNGTTRPDGWDDCDNDQGYIPIGGTQRSVAQFPPGGVIAPEDENLARPLRRKAAMKFEMHFVNATDKPILREAWVNFLARPPIEGSQVLGGVFMIGGLTMAVPPRTKETLSYGCTLNESERRVVSLFGHRHAHTTRFSVFANRGGQRELVYEDYDWDEPVELIYNSITENPPPDAATQTSGGSSGILNLQQGDRLEWECEVDNTSDQTLYFANGVYTAEMCNVFGSSVTENVSSVSSFFWFCSPERGIE